MKHLVAFLLLPAAALAAFSACGPTNETGGGGAGGGTTPAACTDAPLCDPILLPTRCKIAGGGIHCGNSADAGTDGGTGGGGGAGGSPGAGGGGGQGGGNSVSPKLVANIQCALGALRDRKVGAVNLLQQDDGPAVCGTRVEIVSFGDGTASVVPVQYCDGDATVETAFHAKLQPPEFFTKCLTASDDATLLDCATNMLGATVAGATCECRGIHTEPLRGVCHSAP
jgi:hypothetical protein